jgi:hypothetical protein
MYNIIANNIYIITAALLSLVHPSAGGIDDGQEKGEGGHWSFYVEYPRTLQQRPTTFAVKLIFSSSREDLPPPRSSSAAVGD